MHFGFSMLGDKKSGLSTREKNQLSHRQVPYLPTHWSTSFIAHTIKTIQCKSHWKEFYNIREKLLGLEKEKKLAILTKKLLNVEAKKAVGFLIRISEEKISSKAIIWRQSLQESKLVVPSVKAHLG